MVPCWVVYSNSVLNFFAARSALASALTGCCLSTDSNSTTSQPLGLSLGERGLGHVKLFHTGPDLPR